MPAAMRPRTYTLAEARALLPQVKALMAQAQAARKQLVAHQPALWDLLEVGLKGILNLGILIQDVDAGLVDFVGMRDGKQVYLCWQYGEDNIEFWHEMDAGFAGRHPIDDRIA